MSSQSAEFFQCYECGQRFRLTEEIAGRTLRCRCGAKVKAPAFSDQTVTAVESLDDTVADVELDEHFDEIESEADAADQPAEETEATEYVRIVKRGVFGWPMGGEVLFFGVLSLVGIACAILAVIVGKYFQAYIIAAVLIAPYSLFRFHRAWGFWSAGRPWLECLLSALGESDERPS